MMYWPCMRKNPKLRKNVSFLLMDMQTWVINCVSFFHPTWHFLYPRKRCALFRPASFFFKWPHGVPRMFISFYLCCQDRPVFGGRFVGAFASFKVNVAASRFCPLSRGAPVFFRDLEEEMQRYIKIFHGRHAAWHVNIVFTHIYIYIYIHGFYLSFIFVCSSILMWAYPLLNKKVLNLLIFNMVWN